MAHVVYAVRILAVPAGRECDDGANSTGTHLLRQELAVRGATVDVAVVPGRRHAAVTHLAGCPGLTGGGVANEHSESWLEGRDFLVRVRRGNVVHCDTSVGAKALADKLRDTPVCAIACAEVLHSNRLVI